MKRRTVLASGLAAAFASGCGGGTDATKAQVRLVNASAGYSALDLTVDDTRLQVGSSRVDLQACKLEYSIVSPK